MIISFDDFIAKYLDKPCEVTGGGDALNQCVDLANAYIQECLGQAIIPHCNAQDFPTKVDKNIYDYILNTPDNEPIKGDILILKNKNGIGHICVCVKVVDKNTVQSFDENWPLKALCKLVNHPYNYGGYDKGQYEIAGWLRCKIKPVITNLPTMTQEQTNIMNFILTAKVKDATTGELRNVTEGDVRQGIGYITDNIDKTVKDLEGKVKTLTTDNATLTGKLTVNGKTAAEWQTAYTTANSENETLKTQTIQAATVGALFEALVNRLFKK